MNSTLLGVILIAVVGALALLLRRAGSGGASAPPARGDEASAAEPISAEVAAVPAAVPATDEPEAGDEEEDAEPAARLVATSLGGEAFLALEHEIRVVQAPGRGRSFSRSDLTSIARLPIGREWRQGEMRAARIAPVAAGAPARLEAIGPDGEYWRWEFATRDEAAAAEALLREREVITPEDVDDGAAPDDEDFDAARYEAEAIEAEATANAEPIDAAGSDVPDAEAGTVVLRGDPDFTPSRAPDAAAARATIPPLPPLDSAEVAAEDDGMADSAPEEDPLPPLARQGWILDRMAELVRAHPDPFLCAPLVTPTERCFPDPWTADGQGAALMVRRLLAYARVPFAELRVEVVAAAGAPAEDGENRPPAAGASDPGPLASFTDLGHGVLAFRVAEELLADSTRLGGVLAREAAHAWRAQQRLIVPDRAIEAPLTDLTAVHLGFGILLENGRDDGGSEEGQGGAPAAGGLTGRDLAFALAVQAVACDVSPKEIRRWLQPTGAVVFEAAFEALEDVAGRLGLPPRESWPEAWDHPLRPPPPQAPIPS